MEEKWIHYFHKHTRLVTLVVVTAFLVLAAGEYYLYRKLMVLNRMVSEGFMQVKDEMRVIPK